MNHTVFYSTGLCIIYHRTLPLGLQEENHILAFYFYTPKIKTVSNMAYRFFIPKTLYGVWLLSQEGNAINIKNIYEFLFNHDITKFSYYSNYDKVYSMKEFPYLL